MGEVVTELGALVGVGDGHPLFVGVEFVQGISPGGHRLGFQCFRGKAGGHLGGQHALQVISQGQLFHLPVPQKGDVNALIVAFSRFFRGSGGVGGRLRGGRGGGIFFFFASLQPQSAQGKSINQRQCGAGCEQRSFHGKFLLSRSFSHIYSEGTADIPVLFAAFVL